MLIAIVFSILGIADSEVAAINRSGINDERACGRIREIIVRGYVNAVRIHDFQRASSAVQSADSRSACSEAVQSARLERRSELTAVIPSDFSAGCRDVPDRSFLSVYDAVKLDIIVSVLHFAIVNYMFVLNAGRDLPRCHLQGTKAWRNGIVAFLRCRIRPVDAVGVCCFTHIGQAAGYGELGCFIGDKSFNRSVHRQRCSVVLFLLGLSRYGQFRGIDLDGICLIVDFQLAGNVYAFRVADDNLVNMGRYAILSSNIRCFSFGLSHFKRISLRQLGDIHQCGQWLAVIGDFSLLRLHSDFAGILVNSQRSDALTDGVVAFRCGAVPGQAVGVIRGTYLLLLSGSLEGRRLFLDKSGNCSFGRQRLAVIGHFGTRCDDGQGSRCHGNCSVYLLDIQLIRYIIACGVPDHQCVRCSGHCSVVDVLHPCGGFSLLQRIAGRQGAYRHGRAMRFTVVYEALARCGYDNFIAVLRNRQAADGFRNLVVAFLCGAFAPVNGIAIHRSSDCSLGSGYREECRFFSDESIDGSFTLQRGSVVYLVRCFRLNSQDSGLDRDFTVHSLDVQLAGNVFACGVPDNQRVNLRFNCSLTDIRYPCGGCDLVQGIAIRQLADFHSSTLGLSVVSEVGALRCHGDLIGILADDQLSDGRIDRVIAFVCRAVPGQAVGVFALADLGLRTGNRECCRLIIDESSDRSIRGQRMAVIDLLVALRVDRQLRGCDADISLYIGNVQLFGHIFAFRVQNHKIIGVGFHSAVKHVGYSRGGCCAFNAVSVGKPGHCDRRAVSLSVIGEGSARRGRCNLALIFCNCKRA